MRLPHIRIDFSLTVGDDSNDGPTGPVNEAQIGTHHDTGWVDTGMGFQTPGTTILEDDE